MKRILLTGGGTAGHVTPNIALLPALREAGFDIVYVGGKEGMERKLIENEGVAYYGISAGKLRRYLSAENIKDAFKVAAGMAQAAALVRKLKPDIVFSKGGFVAVPVVVGARLNGVPIVAHESDITPGLANKLAIPFAKAVCTTFEATLKFLPEGKAFYTGTPIRRELFTGDAKRGRKLCGFGGGRPVVLFMGGSLGSVKINERLRAALPRLTKRFDIAHICGRGNKDEGLEGLAGYRQFEFISRELKDIFAMADVIVSRAGSNSISEFLALKKPNLLIPLSIEASRGDQILNAAEFRSKGYSDVLKEEDMTEESLTAAVFSLYENRSGYIDNMARCPAGDGVAEVMKVINSNIKK